MKKLPLLVKVMSIFLVHNNTRGGNLKNKNKLDFKNMQILREKKNIIPNAIKIIYKTAKFLIQSFVTIYTIVNAESPKRFTWLLKRNT